MQIGAATAIARQWVQDVGQQLPGFAGAFLHGSVVGQPESAALPAGSDLDVLVVLAADAAPQKLGKFLYHGVLLEISYISQAEVATPERVLGTAHLAGSLRYNGILADPNGQLHAVQQIVARDFARHHWVRQRCDDVLRRLNRNLAAAHTAPALADRVMAWLFGAGLTTHLLLVAGLENPTVRRRYVAVRELLARYGQSAAYEPLLALLGCSAMTQQQAAQHLTTLTAAFTAAERVVPPDYPFAADISPQGRAVALDGTATLIAQGDHREAIFWLLATATRCQQIFALAAPELVQEHQPAYLALLADLGITTPDDLPRRAADVTAILPEIQAVADDILHRNAQILPD